MRHLDLFSGIGGFALAASWVWGDEHEIVSLCDNDKAAQVVLKHHWPGVPIHDDIKTLDATEWRGTVDLVTGGFPCQPFSCAGKRRGAADDRYLWPEMLRVIDECQPRWVLGENVPGIIGMELDKVLADLEGIGYEVGPLIVPACSVGAWQRRRRLWIVAHLIRKQDDIELCRPGRSCGFDGRSVDTGAETARPKNREASNNNAYRLPPGYGGNNWDIEPHMGRMVYGIPLRSHRLRLLGNAIVPQVAAEIFRCMKAIDETVPIR